MDMNNHLMRSSMISKRRTNKPVVEKKRRERINRSLEELKKLVLQSLHKDTEEFEKMEKADILEMAVNHLKNLKKRQAHTDVGLLNQQSDSLVKYRTGYTECATEVMRYLNAVSSGSSVKSRLLDHVSSCVQKVHSVAPVTPRVAPVATFTPTAAASGTLGGSSAFVAPSATPCASLPGSSGSLSSFTPVRKSPTEAFEAPHIDYASGLGSTLPSPGFSPIDFRMNLMMGPFALQSPSQHSLTSCESRSRSTTPTQSSQPADNAAPVVPFHLAAMDLEELRAKYGNVWRPW